MSRGSKERKRKKRQKSYVGVETDIVASEKKSSGNDAKAKDDETVVVDSSPPANNNNQTKKSWPDTKPKQNHLWGDSGKNAIMSHRPRTSTDPLALRFSPTAWAKLVYFCQKEHNEIGGFGIAREDDLLFVEDFMTVKQTVSTASVEFDDESVADYVDEQVDMGRKPEQFFRVWLHTHPNISPSPSGVDEETLTQVFGNCDWAVMFIMARDGSVYCRLRFNVGPKADIDLPVIVDFTEPFISSDLKAWKEEYDKNIHEEMASYSNFCYLGTNRNNVNRGTHFGFVDNSDELFGAEGYLSDDVDDNDPFADGNKKDGEEHSPDDKFFDDELTTQELIEQAMLNEDEEALDELIEKADEAGEIDDLIARALEMEKEKEAATKEVIID